MNETDMNEILLYRLKIAIECLEDVTPRASILAADLHYVRSGNRICDDFAESVFQIEPAWLALLEAAKKVSAPATEGNVRTVQEPIISTAARPAAPTPAPAPHRAGPVSDYPPPPRKMAGM